VFYTNPTIFRSEKVAFRNRGMIIKSTAEAQAKPDPAPKPQITCACETKGVCTGEPEKVETIEEN
jgi:hypothetical protein